MTVGNDVLDLPAVELAVRLDRGELTSVALTDGYLERIAKVGPGLNCFITVTAERARTDAAKADAARASGTRGPLLGIPYALKDIIDTAGIPTTWGTRGLLDRVPERDAEVEGRLRAAGAVLLGKLSLSELANAFDTQFASNHGGACRNPWDRTRWAGGSSSGAGAAVAAGLCAFALGSETAGSIDCPAAFCGVTGLRPTYDLVSRRGVMAVSWTLDKVGVLCRDARDAVAVLGVIGEAPVPGPDVPLRIGVVEPWGGKPDPAHVRAWEAARGVIQSLGGAAPVTVDKNLVRAVALETVLLAERQIAFEDFIATGKAEQMYHSTPWPRLEREYRSYDLRAEDYVKAMRVRAHIQRDWHDRLGKLDVVVSMGRPEVAPVIDAPDHDDGPDSHGQLIVEGNLAGLPAITLPIGLTAEGLPVSMHAVASPYDDQRLLAFAQAFQARTEFHRARPKA